MEIKNLNRLKGTYLKSLETKNYSKDTIKNYKIAINKFINYCKAEEITEVTPATIDTILENYQEKLIATGKYTTTTVNQYIINLKPYLSKQNLITKVDNVKDERNKEIKYLTYNEVKELIETIEAIETTDYNKKQYTTLINFLFYTGARVSEAEKVNINDVKKDNTSYYVTLHGKGNKTVSQFLPTKLYECIAELVELRGLTMNSKEPLFITVNGATKGNRLSKRTIQNYMKKIGALTDERIEAKTGVRPAPTVASRLTPHSLRHSLAIHLLMTKKQPINTVKDILRHESITTTQRYLILSNNEVRKISNEIFN